jgi:hypothetical protein
LNINEQVDWVFKILESLSANQPRKFVRESAKSSLNDTFVYRV